MARSEEEITNKIEEIENLDYPIAKQAPTQYRPQTDKINYSNESVWFQVVE